MSFLTSESWKVRGSDGYWRDFKTEPEARHFFNCQHPMQNIDTFLERIIEVVQIVEIRPKTGKAL